MENYDYDHGDNDKDETGSNEPDPIPENIVFRMLCPTHRIDSIVGESDGIMELLRDEVGVEIKVDNPVPGSNEQIITVTSNAKPDDPLFPEQEALLHIQNRIFDLDKKGITNFRLLFPRSHLCCLERRDGSIPLDKKTGVKIQILPKNEIPACVSGNYALLQIEGNIIDARNALVEVTLKIRSYLYEDSSQKDPSPPRHEWRPVEIFLKSEKAEKSQAGGDASSAGNKDLPTTSKRILLEVVVPEPLAKLVTKSTNKLEQISQLSGADVILVEDVPADLTGKIIIRISGTPEQTEKAHSLLESFV